MAATAPRELQVCNPATLEPVGSVRATEPAAVQEVVVEARLAQERWAETAPAERRAVLARAAEVVLDHLDELAATVTAETGKPLLESYASDLLPVLETLVWLARNAASVLRPERVRQPLHLRHKRGRLVYEPLGVVGVIAPWNFPVSIPLGEAATAVAAGNAVVVKPSELTPLSGAWVERVFEEAGVPKGLVRVVQGDGEAVGGALVRARGLGKLIFTGSVETGRAVAAAAGERLVPVTLELGGKDPMLVFEDADVDRAVDGALWAGFLNCGQVCSGVERIYVQRGLYEPFVEELARRAAALRVGRGEDPDTELGPLISEEQRRKVEGLVDDAVAQGAEARVGGRRPDVDLPGWFYEPTVLVGARGRVDVEEIFGPVVAVAAFGDDDEAVRLANASRYALGASVWTRDLERARRLARRLHAGSVWTNDHAYSYGSCSASWGGGKESGFGRTHSKHGLYAVTHVKYVDEDRGRLRAPWWFPYDDRATAGLRAYAAVAYGDNAVGTAWRERRALAALARRYLR